MSFDGPPASGSFPQAPPAPSLVGTVLDGRYRIIKLIGEGGMGEVYAAEHVHIDKKFAIKMLKQEIVSNAEAVTRFRQEARSSSSIGHRNIIAIEDFGQLSDGRIYMCMELLNGAALNDLIQQPMPVDRMLNILIQTGHGLAAAHAKGIIHRDMKPENVFVTIDAQGQDVPKLLDFGIAKVSGNEGQNNLTRTGTIFGTPFYMAPEQALGNPVDARTDIYAVGVIMYECFSGSLPFQGESFMGILTQHITTEPEPVAQRAAKAGRQLPPGIADIITRCMQKDPARRYSSMDELVNALIAVYRGIAGPGMSTYMEAFPVGSAKHMMQPTPPPMSGAFGSPHSATIAAPSGGYAPPHMMPPQMTPPGMVAASPSGMYDPSASASAVAPKKSKMGLVIAIFVVLAAGGGIAAFVLLQKDTEKKGGTDSGSQVASNDPGSGSTTPHVGSSVTPIREDAAVVVAATPDAAEVKVSPDASVEIVPPPVEATDVMVLAKGPAAFEVWENGKKLDDGPMNVKVTKGTPRTVEVRATGFKPKEIKLDGDKPKVMVKLDKLPGHHVIVTNPVQPNQLDCSRELKDHHDKHCLQQFCSAHEDDVLCGLQ